MRDRLRGATVAVLAFVFAYALLRYVAFGDTPLSRIPAFVGNKAISVAAHFLLGLSLMLPTAELRARAGLTGLWASVVHVVLSQTIAGPAYFPKLHGPDGALTIFGELSMFAGAIAFALVAMLASPLRGWSRSSAHLARLALALVALHCLAIGWAGWLRPSTWPAGLPPISLLSCLWAVFALAGSVRTFVGNQRPSD